MNRAKCGTWSGFLLASLLAFPPPAFPAVPAARRAQARETYERAERLRATLEAQPENARRKADYEKVVQTFQSVYRLNPAYSKSPAALAAVAELREEMGRRFSSDRYYFEAVRTYQLLIAGYPQNRLARDALFTLGEVYRTDLEDLVQARKAFESYLEKYPKSAKAAEAKEKLEQIARMESERGNRSASRGPSAAEPGVTETPRADQAYEVTALRRWVGPNYTRIVISVGGEVKFDASRLVNPDRIVFDLSNTRPSPALVGKPFPMEGGYLREVRVAQFRPNVTRIVLDVEKIEDYSVFTLPNPFRLVIDIHGTPAAVAETPSPAKTKAAQKTAPPLGEAPRTAVRAANAGTAAATGPATATRETREKESRFGAAGETRAAETKAGPVTATRGHEGETKETASARTPSLPRSSTSEPGAAASHGSASPALPATPTESGSRTLTRALGLKIGRIVIDPGHGGHDTGTIGPTGLLEKDLVLDVALRLKKLMERNTGSEVVVTRSEDVFVPLEERTAIANEKAADLFISIHANASRDRSARGIETYYLNFTSNPDALEVAARENATTQESVHELQDLIKKIAMTEKIEESHEFAMQIQRTVHASLVKAGGKQQDRGVKKAPFVVLIGANMPSILAEISFLTNPRDERLLKRQDYRQKISEALYQGIARYMSTLGTVKLTEQVAAPERSQANRPNF